MRRLLVLFLAFAVTLGVANVVQVTAWARMAGGTDGSLISAVIDGPACGICRIADGIRDRENGNPADTPVAKTMKTAKQSEAVPMPATLVEPQPVAISLLPRTDEVSGTGWLRRPDSPPPQA